MDKRERKREEKKETTQKRRRRKKEREREERKKTRGTIAKGMRVCVYVCVSHQLLTLTSPTWLTNSALLRRLTAYPYPQPPSSSVILSSCSRLVVSLVFYQEPQLFGYCYFEKERKRPLKGAGHAIIFVKGCLSYFGEKLSFDKRYCLMMMQVRQDFNACHSDLYDFSCSQAFSFSVRSFYCFGYDIKWEMFTERVSVRDNNICI